MMLRSLLCGPLSRTAVTLAVAVAIASPAHAWAPAGDTSDPAGELAAEAEAQEHLDAAAAAFKADDFETAVAKFEEAYKASGDPACLFNIGRVHEEAGQLQAALDRYEEFIVQPGVELQNRAMANERIGVLREILQTTRARDEPVPPPSAATHPAETRTDSASKPAGRGLIIAGAVVTGVGAAGVILGGVFQALSSRNASRVDSAPNAERRDELEAAAIRDATVGDASLISGAVLVAAGVPMLVVGLIRRKRSTATDVAFQPGGLSLRF